MPTCEIGLSNCAPMASIREHSLSSHQQNNEAAPTRLLAHRESCPPLCLLLLCLSLFLREIFTLMKDMAKIFLIALPFSWLASIALPFLNQLGIGIWMVETFSIRGYWPVNFAFYMDDLLAALLVTAPYVGMIFLFIPNNKFLTVSTALFAYMLFTFLLCIQVESIKACFYTLLQSADVAVYAAIMMMFTVLSYVWEQRKKAQ